jgi:hypothetical protein
MATMTPENQEVARLLAEARVVTARAPATIRRFALDEYRWPDDRSLTPALAGHPALWVQYAPATSPDALPQENIEREGFMLEVLDPHEQPHWDNALAWFGSDCAPLIATAQAGSPG